MSHINIIDRLVEEGAAIAAPASPLKLFAHWLVVTLVSTGLIVSFMTLRPDIADRLASPLFVMEIASLFFVTLTTAVSAVWLCYPDLRQNAKMVFLPLLPVAIFILLCLYRVSDPGTTSTPLIKSEGFDCTLCVISFAVVPGFWMFYLLRRNATTYPQSTGAISFVTSSSIGLLVLKLVEPNDSVLHLMQWHLSPIIFLAIIGTWLGKKYLAW